MAKAKRFLLNLGLVLLSVVLCLTILEIALLFLRPQVTLYPRWKYSPKYGHVLFEDRVMTHSRGYQWSYRYDINSLGYRGPEIVPVDARSGLNVVLLGDSYTFGTGIAEGAVYRDVLAGQLGSSVNVINLAVGGWGLTQQIRRYYEFGVLFKPKVVVLQFCETDLEDNILNRVTVTTVNGFAFLNTEARTLYKLKIWLSDSILQKSHIYNLVRDRLYRIARSRFISKAPNGPPNSDSIPLSSVSTQEHFYAELLSRFAWQLKKEDVALLLISVGQDLERSLFLWRTIGKLHSDGALQYVDTNKWFDIENSQQYASPEGHLWGREAHKVIGESLAQVISEMFSDSDDS